MSCLVLSNREEVNAAIVLISITSHLLHYTRLWYSEGLIKRCAMVDVHLRVGHGVPTLAFFVRMPLTFINLSSGVHKNTIHT